METNRTDERLRHRLELQSMQIERFFSRQEVPATVRGGSVHNGLVNFDLQSSLTEGLGRLFGLSQDLAAALGVPEVSLSRDSRGRLRLSINRSKSHPVDLLDLLEMMPASLEPSAVLGLDYQDRPVLLNLCRQDLKNILITGGYGAGKTSLLRTVALSLAHYYRQSQVQLAIIGPQFIRDNRARGENKLYPLDYIPHMIFPVVDTLVEAAEALDFLVSELAYRREQNLSVPLLVILIDDLDLLLDSAGEPVRRPLVHLLQADEATGVRLIFSAANPNHPLLSPLLKHNVTLRLVGQVEDAGQARAVTGQPNTQAEYLRGDGDFLAITYGNLVPFQAAYVDDYDLHHKVAELHRSRRPALLAKPVEQEFTAGENGHQESRVFQYDAEAGEIKLGSKDDDNVAAGQKAIIQEDYAKQAEVHDLVYIDPDDEAGGLPWDDEEDEPDLKNWEETHDENWDDVARRR